MMILFFSLIGLFILSLILMFPNNLKINNIGFEIYKIAMIGLFFYSIIGLINLNKPSAMDVYQGKTTIEITYIDGVAVDSVVVFKDNGK